MLVGAVDFGIGSIIDDDQMISNQCKVEYTGIFDNDGNPLNAQTFSRGDSSCHYTSFDKMKTAFDGVIDTLLGKNSDISIVETQISLELIQLATNIAGSYVWQNCLSEALSFVDGNTLENKGSEVQCLDAEGSPEWEANPCCNQALSTTQCCIASPYTQELIAYSENDDVTLQRTTERECTYPKCLLQALDVLASTASSGALDYCKKPRQTVQGKSTFKNNPWNYCKAVTSPPTCSISAQCVGISPLSVCDEAGQFQKHETCTVPCPDGDCYAGDCKSTIFGDICVNLPDPEVAQPKFLQCLLALVDGNLRVQIVDQLSRLPTYNATAEAFENLGNAISVLGCLAPDNTPWPNSASAAPDGTVISEEQCRTTLPFCATLGCTLQKDDELDLCKSACEETFPLGGGVCVWDLTPLLNVPMNRPGLCQIRMEDSLLLDYLLNPYACFAFGGSYIGPDRLGYRTYDPCLKKGQGPYGATLTPNECYTKECIPNLTGDGVTCHGYCYNPNITDSMTCQGPFTAG